MGHPDNVGGLREGLEKLTAGWVRLSNDKYIAHRDREFIAGFDEALRRCAKDVRELCRASPAGGDDGITDLPADMKELTSRNFASLMDSAPAGGDEPVDDKCSWCGRPKSSNALSHDPRCLVRTKPQSAIAIRELAYRDPVSAPAGSGEVDELAKLFEEIGDAAKRSLTSHVTVSAKSLRDAAALLRKLQQGAE